MSLEGKEFPVKTIENLRLTSKELVKVETEHLENSSEDFIEPQYLKRNYQVLEKVMSMMRQKSNVNDETEK